MHRHRHAAGVAVADLDMAIDHHRGADEAHGAHADIVAELLEFLFDRRDPRIRIARADDAQARGLLAENHAGIFRAAEPDADDGGLAGEPALAEADQRVEIKPLDARDAVGGKQHAVVGAEQAALVHGGQLEPVGVGVEGIFDLGRVYADIVVVIGAPQRMHAVGPQRHRGGRPRGGAAQRRFERHRTALDARVVADLDVPARQAGIAAHGAAVLFRRLVVFQHGLDDEGRQIALLGIGAAAQAVEIILGDFDGRLRHQILGGALNGCDRDHGRGP